LVHTSLNRKIGQLLGGVWLIIAGGLLLAPSEAAAGSYIKIWEKGVVHYYYSNRGRGQGQGAGSDSPAAGPGVRAREVRREAGGAAGQKPRLLRAVLKMEAERGISATAPRADADLGELRLGRAMEEKAVKASDPTENIWIGPRYLGRLWANGSFASPLAPEGAQPGSRHPDGTGAVMGLGETQALVRQVCRNFLGEARVPSLYGGHGQAGAALFLPTDCGGYCFPVAPTYSFRDTWGDRRSGGRYHHAVDIFAWEGTPVYAITGGVIDTLTVWPGAGITLLLRAQDGRGYGYMHLRGYAPGIVEGKAVRGGELIAYVGHTGVRQDAPHLHLQVYADHRFARDELVNPYGLLVQLSKGQGVTDPGPRHLARWGIPTATVMNYGTVRLSAGPGPPRYRGRLGGLADTALIHP
jgi:hypothetical protein